MPFKMSFDFHYCTRASPNTKRVRWRCMYQAGNVLVHVGQRFVVLRTVLDGDGRRVDHLGVPGKVLDDVVRQAFVGHQIDLEVPVAIVDEHGGHGTFAFG